MDSNELKIIQDFYDFMLFEKFPRHHRYSLGYAIENRMQKIFELLLKAKYRSNKRDILSEANIELELLRFQLRLSKDLEILSVKSYGFGSKNLLAIGSQAGGWIKSV